MTLKSIPKAQSRMDDAKERYKLSLALARYVTCAGSFAPRAKESNSRRKCLSVLVVTSLWEIHKVLCVRACVHACVCMCAHARGYVTS